jgi:2-polyprenyl-3-methyl-5-hydroxy-6-metoxy-1,4-benzoquinol methylase
MSSMFEKRIYSSSYRTLPLTRCNSITFHRTYAHLLPSDKNSPILDFGGGSGRLSEWLISVGYNNVYLCDLEETIEQYKYPPAVNAFHSNKLVNYVNFFSIVILNDVLEHIERQALFSVLTTIRQSMSSDGLLAGRIPNASSPCFGVDFYSDLTHYSLMNSQSIAQILIASGFNNISIKSSPVVFSANSFINSSRLVLMYMVLILRRITLMALGARTDSVARYLLFVSER